MVHGLCGFRAHAPNLLNAQLVDKLLCTVGVYGRKPVGFPPVGGNLGQQFVVGNTCRGSQLEPFVDLLLDFAGNVNGQFYAGLVFRDIQKSFVERYGFNKVGIFVEDFMHLPRYLLILLIIPVNDNQVLAK